MRRPVELVLPLLLICSMARADSPPTRTQFLLLECRTPAGLRSSLESYADSVAATEPFASGEACAALAACFGRAGQRDSAIAWCARAVERRGDTEERLGLADLLLERGRGDDLSRATNLLRSCIEGVESPQARLPYRARLAWAMHLCGRSDSAATEFAEIETALASSLEWSERMGRADLAAGRPGAALRWLSPVAVASRGRAEEIMALVRATAAAMPAGAPKRDLAAQIAQQIAAADATERGRLAEWEARRVWLTATDGFPLGGVVIAPADGVRRRGAVVLVEAGEPLLSCDSLVAALRAADLAVMLLERRGTGGSIGPSCPLPRAWHGREQALEERCARDVRDALRALAAKTPLDTSRYVAVGIGETVTAAVRAAHLDPRLCVLMLVSPAPHPVDRGAVRATIETLQRPIFFQIAPEDFPLFELTDALYQAGDRPGSRVSDARGGGRGAAQFRGDRSVAARFRSWLAAAMAGSGRPATRPTRPRRR